VNTSPSAWRPSYLKLARSGELDERVEQLDRLLADCTVCPRSCHVDRRRELGECATGADAVIASWNPHHGEEPVISNEELATIFIDLQDHGCHNINWVSPSHQVPQLVRALAIAAGRGLSIPIVYNTNGYDSIEVLRLLDGIIDIYMPDLKYADPDAGCRLSGVEDYPRRAHEALAEMYRQVGNAWDLGPEGELRRGLLVRMLVLPEGLAGIEENLAWIAHNLAPTVTISLLAQYRPAHRVPRTPDLADLNRSVSRSEWQRAVAALEENMEGDRHHVQGVWL